MYTCVVHVARVNKCLLCALVCVHVHAIDITCLSAVEGSDPRLAGLCMDVRCSVRPQKPCAASYLAQAGIPQSWNFTDWGTCCLHRGAEEHPGPPPRPGPPGIPWKLSESLKGHCGELEHCATSAGALGPAPAQVLPFLPKGPISFLPGANPPVG